MHDLDQFVAACWTSGTILRSACALILIPPTAWLLIHLLVPAIERLDSDPEFQAPLAAIAAMIPGSLLLTLAGSGVSAGARSACFQTVTGRVLFGLMLIVTVGMLARAFVLAARRTAEASLLLRCSEPASGHLDCLAQRCGVRARTIADERPLCALVGIRRPTVVISHGALTSLSRRDEELVAVLLHERGHARRGDQFIAAVLSFMVDLVPLPAAKLVSTYRRAREFAADRYALRTSAPYDIAGALLSFVSGGTTRGVAAVPMLMDEQTTLRERLHWLLIDADGKTDTASLFRSGYFLPFVLRRCVLSLVIGLILGAGVAPAAAAFVHPMPCTTNAERPANVDAHGAADTPQTLTAATLGSMV